MSMEMLNAMNGKLCRCGKLHSYDTEVIVGGGVIHQIPGILSKLGAKKPYILSDRNTWEAAGRQICEILREQQIPFHSFRYEAETMEPDEASVGSAMMHLDMSCDLILGVGSGVINDIGKLVSLYTGKPYVIVATAPSMDGYASATSSMNRDGLKVSLPSRAADVIVGDTDVLRNAPLKMMKSGLGDMLAKYVSICEWRIANLLLGEYYCEDIAQLIREAVKACVSQADGLLRRDESAVRAVFEGLVIGGVAMNYAGLSRPASGCEHYISHVVDMRAVQFGTPMDLHGIQCAIGTLEAVRLYEKLKAITPDREKAIAYVAGFDKALWNDQLRDFLGLAAESMIALEEKEKKYDRGSHRQRLETILGNWENILRIMQEELPTSKDLEALLDAIEAPKSLPEIGIDGDLLPMIVRCSKDIRDKYVLTRLLWDLGVLEEVLV